MDLNDIKNSYRLWAPVYDKTFGAVSSIGRRRAIKHLNTLSGHVLEVGVGTGLSLKHYAPHIQVTGIDVSPHMLNKARKKIERKKLSNMVDVHEMDAREMAFPDNHFDAVVAMYLISVVPDPEQVISEMARVCKPGGEVIIVNHFARDQGPLSVAEKAIAPFANKIGWHADFPLERTQGQKELVLREQLNFPPLGMFTFLRMEKQALSSAA